MLNIVAAFLADRIVNRRQRTLYKQSCDRKKLPGCAFLDRKRVGKYNYVQGQRVND